MTNYRVGNSEQFLRGEPSTKRVPQEVVAEVRRPMCDYNEAPIHYNNDEAHAWAAGYEAAMERIERIIEAQRETEQGASGLMDPQVIEAATDALDAVLAAIRGGDDANVS
jgi:hypothetical protein